MVIVRERLLNLIHVICSPTTRLPYLSELHIGGTNFAVGHVKLPHAQVVVAAGQLCGGYPHHDIDEEKR